MRVTSPSSTLEEIFCRCLSVQDRHRFLLNSGHNDFQSISVYQ